jgi:tetratricopeptide (TPR) repeat protein
MEAVTLTQDAELPASFRRTIPVRWWRIRLGTARLLGHAAHWVFVEGRSLTLLLLLAPAAVLELQGERAWAATVAGLWLALLLLLAVRGAQDRLIVGEFKWYAEKEPDEAEKRPTPPLQLDNLLLVEISRLADLFKVVGDRRAVNSGLGRQRALDATLSVDDLVENLQGTVNAAAKVGFGPLSIPLAPLVSLFGRLAQARRLTGNLHRDGRTLILTAQLSRSGMSWRVQRPEVGNPAAADVEIVVSEMVEELGLRVYTDIALGRAVRWHASKRFVDGLRSFRAALRTPKDRKYNLKRAEEQFLAALAEDEDFPLVYYNLGVVYTELHGLAVAGGRKSEAETRLSAAETAFGRAIEKDPTRWEAYFAFAQTQLRYSRFDSVVEVCDHIVHELEPDTAGTAKSEDLWARALVARDQPGDEAAALLHARRASGLALRALARARRRPSGRASGEDTPESRCAELASGCLLTFSDVYSRQMPAVADLAEAGRTRRKQERVRRRAQALAALAPVTQGRADVRFDFGRRLLAGGHLELAEEELAEAVRSDPTRPSYAAGLALARARLATRRDDDAAAGSPPPEVPAAKRDEIIGLCLRALQGMAGAFYPSRDAEACRMVADVFAQLGSASDKDEETAASLHRVADVVEARLSHNVAGAAVSSVFLEALQAENTPLATKIGDYGEAAQKAKATLLEGQEHSQAGRRDVAQDAFSAALDAAERATSLNPLSTLAWETLGDVHRELSDFHNARIAWKQALSTDPDNPRLYDKIGSSYWHIAFQGRTRVSEADLMHASEYFRRALTLYGSGSLDEQRLTHYRLGKLNTALREFDAARQHLEIVEATQKHSPLVGWQLFGFAHLQGRHFSEAEYYFKRVIRDGDQLGAELPADAIIGDRLDEQLWPLGLIRAWGNLGLAITHAERDGDLAKALEHVVAAEACLAELELDEADPASDERFPTRAPAACCECRGLIFLRDDDFEKAIPQLEQAVSRYPHSRAYFELGLALEQKAAATPDAAPVLVARAERLFRHGVSLRPPGDPPDEVRAAMQRIGAHATNGAGAA